MGSQIKPAFSQPYKGVRIYVSAHTHPGSKTRTLIVFHRDLTAYPNGIDKEKDTRFRYTVGDGKSFAAAHHECCKLISKYTSSTSDGNCLDHIRQH